MINLDTAIHRVLDAYCRTADLRDVPIRVDTLKEAVCSYAKVDKIAIREVNIVTKHVIGQVRFHRDIALGYGDNPINATIYITRDLNDCWRRYVTAKEIMHCVIDDKPEAQVGDMKALIELAEGLVNRTLSGLMSSTPLTTELAAEIMATEVLLPLELRERHFEDYQQGLLTDMQIALRYKVPEMLVRSAMSTTYMAIMRSTRHLRVALPK